MEAHKHIQIGLFGFGVVGQGIYRIIQQIPELNVTIKRICIKQEGKKRMAPDCLFTTDQTELLNDADINLIVEVINDANAAFKIVSNALGNGKDVISANKKMIAENLPALLELQEKTGRSLLYEAAACASIPVIRNLEEYYNNDTLYAIRGIVNGSTNFILTKMFEEGLCFKTALLQAQQLGFAEANPRLDVEGYDALYKWILLLTHAYGIILKPEHMLFNGIQNIDKSDANVAKSKGFTIRLVAQAKKLRDGNVAAFVFPQFVKQDDFLAYVKNEFNGVVFETAFSDKQLFYGKGAGSFPTASAVISDIAALQFQYRYAYKKLFHHPPHIFSNDIYLRVYVRFDELSAIPVDRFEWIEEWHVDEDSNYLIGGLALEELRNNQWWRENNISLVLSDDPVVQESELVALKARSVDLAVYIHSSQW